MPIFSKDLQERIAKLEVEQEKQLKEVTQLSSEIQPAAIGKLAKKELRNGFVVKLDFGGGAPISEWSDETHGWRTEGLGTRYPDEKKARQKWAELRKMWPDYPLKISQLSQT